MPEYTQEQIDQMIADAKKGMFTEEDLNRRVTSEVDRRVESGIQKGLETYKSKWEKELSDKAKLTAEELAKQQLEEKESGLTAREKEINRKANLLDAKGLMAEAEIPKAQYEKVIGMLVSEDADATKANVQSFIDMFKETKTEIETKVKSELSKITPPRGDDDKPLTKEAFIKLPYGEKLKLKQSNPELYHSFMK